MNPTFKFLMTKYAELHDAGLDDTEEARQVFTEAMRFAPPEFLGTAHNVAVEMGLIPERPDGYSDDGEPLYELEGIAQRLGLDPQQVMDDMPDSIREGSHRGAVHRVQ